MADNIVQVSLNNDSGLPEDVVVNTWSFKTSVAKDAAAGAIVAGNLITFYGGWQQYMSQVLNGTGLIKFYDRADLKPRVPWLTLPITYQTGGSYLPAEVSIVMSFQAAKTSGAPQARRRGRVFLGPLGVNATDNLGRVGDGARAAIAAAGNQLVDISTSAQSYEWDVWSSIDQIGREVTDGWVDNAFDTIRSRGVAATTRTVFQAGP